MTKRADDIISRGATIGGRQLLQAIQSSSPSITGSGGVGVASTGNGVSQVIQDHASPPAREVMFRIFITGATRFGGSFRWAYAWKEVYLPTENEGWEAKPNGRTSADHALALNEYEGTQGQSGMSGIGVDMDGLLGTGFEIQPIPSGDWPIKLYVTRTKLGQRSYWFDRANGVDGLCTPGLLSDRYRDSMASLGQRVASEYFKDKYR